MKLFKITLIVLLIPCLPVKASEFEIPEFGYIPNNKIAEYSQKFSGKFLYYLEGYLPYEVSDKIKSHPHYATLVIAAISAAIGYGVYVTVPILIKTVTFIYQLHSYLEAGYGTTYSPECNPANMHSLSVLRTLSEKDRIALVGITKERLGIHPYFQGQFEYLASIAYLSKAFNLTWNAVSKAGDTQKLADMFIK